MNKKIYFNDGFILLGNEDLQPSQDQSIKIHLNPNAEELKLIIADFIKNLGAANVYIGSKAPDALFEALKTMFNYIEAAGGFIEKDGLFLFIHRHNRWDLPKGKLEKGESVEAAAVRECEEECGIDNLTIIHALPSTFHLYPYKKSFALKQTYWFYMHSNFKGTLHPQLEEDITEVKWFSKAEIEKDILPGTYYTISDLTLAALQII